MIKGRSYLQWKINLPFMWIKATASDEVARQDLVQGILNRNDMKFLIQKQPA